MSKLPAKWVVTTLAEIRSDRAQSIDPRRTPEVEFELFSVPSLSSGRPEIVAGSEIGSTKKTLTPGTVVISKINPKLNRVWMIPAAHRPQIGSSEWIVFSPVSGVVPSYLRYFLGCAAVRDYLAANVSGVGGSLMRVTPTVLGRFPFPLAPLPEQHRIVAEIDKQFTRLDASTAALGRVRANLKRYRAATLAAACAGRLVPTEAEMARWEGREYESARVQLEREGIVPSPCSVEGWACASVGDIATLVQYGTSAKTSGATVGVPVIRMGNIFSGRLVLEQLKYLPKDHREFPDLMLESGDLLFNRTNSAELVGKSAVFRASATPYSFASYLIRVRLSNALLPDLLVYYLNSTFGRAWIKTVVNQQVGQANVNGSKLKSLVLPVPPLAEQTRIVAEVERRLSFVEKLEAVVDDSQRRAVALRQSILKRAFEGKLVPQDPDDEPTEVLLERIRVERAAMTTTSAPKRSVRKKVSA